MPDDRPAGPEPHQLPPDERPIGQQLALGRHWRPGPASWRWEKLGSTQGPLHVLILEHANGTTAVAFDPDSLARLAAQAQEQISGLTLPNGGLQLHVPNGAGG